MDLQTTQPATPPHRRVRHNWPMDSIFRSSLTEGTKTTMRRRESANLDGLPTKPESSILVFSVRKLVHKNLAWDSPTTYPIEFLT